MGDQVCVDGRVLDIGMAEPVLHEAQVGAGFKHVRGDRVLEHVKVPLVGREANFFSVALYKLVQCDS